MGRERPNWHLSLVSKETLEANANCRANEQHHHPHSGVSWRGCSVMEFLGAHVFGNHREVLSFQKAQHLPKAGAFELLLEVAFAELNPVDLQKLNPRLAGQDIPNGPLVVGYGGSGTVVACGAGVPEGEWLQKRVVFLCDSRKPGSYATHVVVHVKSAAVLPSSISLKEAAAIPLAGCTAFEALDKLQMGTGSGAGKHLFIIGASGGVGSWATLLARCRHPELKITASCGSDSSKEWCLQRLGANQGVSHSDFVKALGGGHKGSMDYVLCLTTPTKELTDAISEVVRPFGNVCLVAPPKESLNLGFFFYKSVTVALETVFSSSRTNYNVIKPASELQTILDYLVSGKIESVPLSPALEGMDLSWRRVLDDTDGNLLDRLASGHTQGKLVLEVAGGT